MKTQITLLSLFLTVLGISQEDTTRINLGKTEVFWVEHLDSLDDEMDDGITKEAHWAGLDFGFNMLVNSSFNQDFGADKFLSNDIARSQVWNLNLLEHKFNLIGNHFGLTTGLGFSFRQMAWSGNRVLNYTPDTLFAVTDSLADYTKNKLKASYITVPLLLEFCSHKENDEGFYLAAGVVGGYRIGSKYKQHYEINGNSVEQKIKRDFHLNPFFVDLTARLGYKDWGVFANYSLLPAFQSGKTSMDAYSFNAGLSLNF